VEAGRGGGGGGGGGGSSSGRGPRGAVRRVTSDRVWGGAGTSGGSFPHLRRSRTAARPPSSTVRGSDGGSGVDSADEAVDSDSTDEDDGGVSSLSSYSALRDSSDKVLEADRRSRGMLFERARYASGELVVHSVMQTLLIRDFTASGFAAAIMTLMGVPGYTGRPLIRQIPVDRTWYGAFQRRAGVAADDARSVWDAPPPSGAGGASGRPPTFRDVFTTLLPLGVVAVGLYRSGEAPVLVPVERREERGRRASGRAAAAGAANANEADAKRPHELDYTNGTTGERWRYAALGAACNKLPYVLTLPEPYTIVAQDDAVFVLAPEELKMAPRWPLLPPPPPVT